MKLKRSFFARPTLTVAQDLLGKYLVRKLPSSSLRAKRGNLVGKIVEVEAYIGEDDLACHASKGRTKRTELLYHKPGTIYVYMIYGMYYCLNIVIEKADYPAAILIRAVEVKNSPSPFPTKTDPPLAEILSPRGRGMGEGVLTDPKIASGPGKLCRYFKIDKTFNGQDLIDNKNLWIEDGGRSDDRRSVLRQEVRPPVKIVSAPRIGVDYAKHCAKYPWRFYIKDNKSVSQIS